VEQVGDPSEPQQPMPSPPDGPTESPNGEHRVLFVVAILVLLGLVGIGAAMVGGGDLDERVERTAGRFPVDSSVPATTAPAETSPAVTTVPPVIPTTVAPTTVPATTTTTIPPTGVLRLVPSIAALPDALEAPAGTQAQIVALLGTPRHDVASTGPVRTLCAVAPLDGPLRVGGRWERNGQRVDDVELADQQPPGYGHCLDNDGDELVDGAYQFLVVDAAGRESAAATFVVGAERIDQRFVNDGEDDICMVLVAPTQTTYFEAYRYDGAPIRPGDQIALPMADVRQDVRALSCNPQEVLGDFDFDPSPVSVRSLR
jgi:hypothetical protein